MIHQLTRRASRSAFASRNRARAQLAAFHPTRPHLLVANERSVRVYDLHAEALVAKLASGARLISTLDVHPGGDHVVLGSDDHRTVWFDTALGADPFKTLRYHTRAVRRVAFHRAAPLLATASDDGTLHVFHARVFADDFGRNPLIVPVKILRGHAVVPRAGGVTDAAFHPTQPWLFSAGADGHIRLWHNVDG
jgi:ribosome biogenesis protein ERB1